MGSGFMADFCQALIKKERIMISGPKILLELILVIGVISVLNKEGWKITPSKISLYFHRCFINFKYGFLHLWRLAVICFFWRATGDHQPGIIFHGAI